LSAAGNSRNGIPINSPLNTAQYNGAIEHTQGEFKDYLRRWEWKANTIDEYALLSGTAAHELNHTQVFCFTESNVLKFETEVFLVLFCKIQSNYWLS